MILFFLKKKGTQQVGKVSSGEKPGGLVARQSLLLSAFPDCLHINEHPIFSTSAWAPTPCLPSSPPISESSAWLSTAQRRPWGLWKEQSGQPLPPKQENHGVGYTVYNHTREDQPPRPVLGN